MLVICFSGASGSGKTTLLGMFIRFRNQMFPEKFHRIIYCYPATDKSQDTQGFIETLKSYCDFLEVCTKPLFLPIFFIWRLLQTCLYNVTYLQVNYGLPDVNALNLVGKKVHSLVILDDLGKATHTLACTLALFLQDFFQPMLSMEVLKWLIFFQTFLTMIAFQSWL